MSNQFLPIIPPTLPSGYCWPSSPQQFVNDAVGGALAQFAGSGFSVVLKQNTTPAAADRDKLWYNTDTTRVLYYNSSVASWVSKHPLTASTAMRFLFVGESADVDTLDGGAPGTVSDTSGPFWEIDTDFAGRSPMGVGAIPSADPAKSLTVAENYGDGSDTLSADQLPELISLKATWNGFRTDLETDATQWLSPQYGSGPFGTPNTVESQVDFTNTNGGEPFSLVHPVRGVYFIKRTARIFYTS